MPLVQSPSDNAFKQNVSTLMGEVGKSAHVKSKDQALAIAYRIKRDHRATGGRIAPSEAQKEAGNYKKDHIRIHGLDIAIENAKGSERSGADKGGKPWSVKMPAHYGYIKRTEGADGDHVDCYIGPHEGSGRVFIVNQHNADSKAFDEHKCMLGFNSATEARETYKRGFSDGRGHDRLGSMKEMSIEQFKHWLDDGDQKIAARASGGPVNSGIVARATGGPAPTPWYARAEAKNLSHVGPISSVVPGRTDAHHMRVPSGAYVFPADLVSGLGQGNSAAGQSLLSKAFSSGPYGASMPHMSAGRKAKFADGGGVGDPVEIKAAGGEFVAHPKDIMRVVHPDLDTAHSILDKWVVDKRKELIRTLKALPGPARD